MTRAYYFAAQRESHLSSTVTNYINNPALFPIYRDKSSYALVDRSNKQLVCRSACEFAALYSHNKLRRLSVGELSKAFEGVNLPIWVRELEEVQGKRLTSALPTTPLIPSTKLSGRLRRLLNTLYVYPVIKQLGGITMNIGGQIALLCDSHSTLTNLYNILLPDYEDPPPHTLYTHHSATLKVTNEIFYPSEWNTLKHNTYAYITTESPKLVPSHSIQTFAKYGFLLSLILPDQFTKKDGWRKIHISSEDVCELQRAIDNHSHHTYLLNHGLTRRYSKPTLYFCDALSDCSHDTPTPFIDLHNQLQTTQSQTISLLQEHKWLCVSDRWFSPLLTQTA